MKTLGRFLGNWRCDETAKFLLFFVLIYGPKWANETERPQNTFVRFENRAPLFRRWRSKTPKYAHLSVHRQKQVFYKNALPTIIMTLHFPVPVYEYASPLASLFFLLAFNIDARPCCLLRSVTCSVLVLLFLSGVTFLKVDWIKSSWCNSRGEVAKACMCSHSPGICVRDWGQSDQPIVATDKSCLTMNIIRIHPTQCCWRTLNVLFASRLKGTPLLYGICHFLYQITR